jgi:hypothetical protein
VESLKVVFGKIVMPKSVFLIGISNFHIIATEITKKKIGAWFYFTQVLTASMAMNSRAEGFPVLLHFFR